VTLYGFLMREGNIPTDWFSRQLAQADRTDGDIDTLSNRIAHVRTWTYVANRPDWLADPEHWQGATRAIEDKLSDALHERLAERFVDRRTSVLMRRLRENTMLETEIGKTGEVTVEGHVIGRLDGFMFAPDASAAAGSEAKTLNAAAQKVLASEIEARATKLSQASNEQIVLANDGALRWTGDLVGKLVAGDDTLRPRVRILADEHLTGPARELVQTRLDLWLKSQIEKLLAPLFSLTVADDITGIARGIAFQLVEALGVLERQKVAEEVKGLDQPSRATLRKYGVRFGAYHIYLPILLKPAPRALATQLWALKHEAPDAKGVTELLHLAASGRTSIPIDKETPKPLYRTAGYRVCGERAVRVDILERLADLIRPALSWREITTTPKPDGAFDGRSFTVTGAMTSLTGASGEDFASILRSLGYRMDRKPKPAETKPVETKPEETKPAEAGETAPAAEAVETPAASISLLPAVEVAPDEPVAAAAPEIIAAAPSEAAAETTVAEAAEVAAPLAGDGAVAAPSAEATKPEEATKSEEAAKEPETIEVWRPGGHAGGERRPNNRPRRAPRAQAATPAADAGAVPPAADGAPAQERKEGAPRHQRPDRNERQQRMERQAKSFEAKGSERPGQPAPHPASKPVSRPPFNKPAGGRPGQPGGRPGGRGDFGGRPRRDKGDQVERAEREQYYAKPHGSGSGARDKAPDPNSPFAKLAALKQQLEGKES
jgi:ATP-dependent RNA helicase SUPV3L1/SUV3